MLEGKAVVRETDMSEAMQDHVMELAYKALDLHEVSDCQSIAYYIKQVLFFFSFFNYFRGRNYLFSSTIHSLLWEIN